MIPASYLNLVPHLNTYDNAMMLTVQLAKFKHDILKSTSVETALKNNFSPQDQDVLGDLFIKKDEEALISEIDQLKNYIVSVPVFSMELPRPITQSFADDISRKIREKLNVPLFVKLTENNELLGGCRIMYNGRFKDYSLKALVEDTVLLERTI